MSRYSARPNTARRISRPRPRVRRTSAPSGGRQRRRPLPSSRAGIPRWFWTLAVLAVLLVCAIAFTTTFLELLRLQREADRLLRMRQTLQQDTATLRAEIRALHTPAYIEKIAREQLGLVRPGEISLLLVQPPPKPAPVPSRPPGEPSRLARVLRALLRPFTGGAR